MLDVAPTIGALPLNLREAHGRTTALVDSAAGLLAFMAGRQLLVASRRDGAAPPLPSWLRGRAGLRALRVLSADEAVQAAAGPSDDGTPLVLFCTAEAGGALAQYARQSVFATDVGTQDAQIAAAAAGRV
ncbi:MAG: hypothetical protein ACYC5O_05415, partial [Anaerolineae bacterium]